jgi:hypothetical protein
VSGNRCASAAGGARDGLDSVGFMETKMDGSERKVYGNLQLERGGLSSREMSPEEWLEREVKAWAAKARTADGRRYLTRPLADIAQDHRYGPHRFSARIIRDGLDEGATTAWAREYGLLLMEYAERRARAMGRLTEQPNRAA